MKLLLAAILVVATVNTASAQQAGNSSQREFAKPSKNESVYMNDISTKAIRDFEKRFGDLHNKQWYRAGDGFVVKFTIRDMAHRSAYNSRGNWIYTIKYYPEAKMPRDIRAVVKRTYFDYTITQVEEVERPDGPVVYVVHMYDADSWINVSVTDGEMEVMEEFEKG
jgi:hypothetical protein